MLDDGEEVDAGIGDLLRFVNVAAIILAAFFNDEMTIEVDVRDDMRERAEKMREEIGAFFTGQIRATLVDLGIIGVQETYPRCVTTQENCGCCCRRF